MFIVITTRQEKGITLPHGEEKEMSTLQGKDVPSIKGQLLGKNPSKYQFEITLVKGCVKKTLLLYILNNFLNF